MDSLCTQIKNFTCIFFSASCYLFIYRLDELLLPWYTFTIYKSLILKLYYTCSHFLGACYSHFLYYLSLSTSMESRQPYFLCDPNIRTKLQSESFSPKEWYFVEQTPMLLLTWTLKFDLFKSGAFVISLPYTHNLHIFFFRPLISHTWFIITI